MIAAHDLSGIIILNVEREIQEIGVTVKGLSQRSDDGLRRVA